MIKDKKVSKIDLDFADIRRINQKFSKEMGKADTKMNKLMSKKLRK